MLATKRRPVGEWILARTLLPIYAEVAPELPPPWQLRDLVDAGTDDKLVAVLAWLDAVDERIAAREFRTRLRAAAGAELSTALEMILERLIAKTPRGIEHVQKVDEACFDYFCVAAPPGFHGRRVTRDDVAAVLEPAIRHAPLDGGLPRGLDQLAAELEAATSLPVLAAGDVLQRARALRLADASGCFERMTLIAFTHFNYAAHVTRTRLARGDAEYVVAAETELRARRVAALDCNCNGNGPEPLEQLLARLRRFIDGDAAITADALRLIAAARLAVERLRGVPPPRQKADNSTLPNAVGPSLTAERHALIAAETTNEKEEFAWEPAWLSNAPRMPDAMLFLPEATDLSEAPSRPAVPALNEGTSAATELVEDQPEARPTNGTFAYDSLEEFCARCYPFARNYRLQRRTAQGQAS